MTNRQIKLSGYPVQNQFTEKEIAELPAWCQALERIEVE